MSDLGSLLTQLTSLAVIVSAVLINDNPEVIDKFIDLSLLLFYQLFILRKTVTARHIHNSHISNRLVLLISALDTHDGCHVLILQFIVIKERSLAGVKIAFYRLPAIVLEPLGSLLFCLTVSDENVADILAAALLLSPDSCRHSCGCCQAECHRPCQKP